MGVNGGTRAATALEEGSGCQGALPIEKEGNLFAEFPARLFAALLDGGKITLAENQAPDGRYPSSWETRWWKRLRMRKDVRIVR